MDTQMASGGHSAPTWQEMEKSSSHILDTSLLEILIIDHSRPKQGKRLAHIIWATDNYESLGPSYAENEQIRQRCAVSYRKVIKGKGAALRQSVTAAFHTVCGFD